MGQAESQPSDLNDPTAPSPRLPTSRYAPANGSVAQIGLAFHVLRVAERSPADEAGVEPFFDFVCGINGRPLGDDIDLLMRVSEQFEERQISLQVYSTKRKELRDVTIIPSRAWSSSVRPSSSGSAESGASLLGLSLRLCDPQHALDQVWHVLEILEGSPAQSAGLVPFGDWIVGYAGGILRGEGDFYDVVEAHVEKPLRLFVYNADYDVTRETILIPNRSWGGEGLLGCGVGYGLLHRIPKPQDRSAVIVTEDGEEEAAGVLPTAQGIAGIGLLNTSTTATAPNPSGLAKARIGGYAPPPPGTIGNIRRTESVASTSYSDLSPPPTSTRRRETLIETPDPSQDLSTGQFDARYGGYASEGVQVIPITVDDGEQDFDFAPRESRSRQTTGGSSRAEGGRGEGEESNEHSGARGRFMQQQETSGSRLGTQQTSASNDGHMSQPPARGTWSEAGFVPPSPWKPPPSPALQLQSRSAV